MAKFSGVIGYEDSHEVTPGVWSGVTERTYFGDVTRNTRRIEGTQDANANISVSNLISVIADPYANQHFFAIRYVKWAGACWKVTNVEVQSPRLILTIGGQYNGETA